MSKQTPETELPKELWETLTCLRIARDRYQKARRDERARHDLALQWMHEDPKRRTFGEAMAYVGIGLVEHERKAAKRAVMECVETLLSAGFDLKNRGQP
jgi:hypothetical protein